MVFSHPNSDLDDFAFLSTLGESLLLITGAPKDEGKSVPGL